MSTKSQDVAKLVERKYKHGFVTDIEADTVPPGLDEDVIRLISRKKNEPQFMLDWRLKAFRYWRGLQEPNWAKLHHPPIDYQAISYYSAPGKKQDGPKSLDEVDPKLLRRTLQYAIERHRSRVLLQQLSFNDELTNLLIPVMRKQGHGRIIQQSSVLLKLNCMNR